MRYEAPEDKSKRIDKMASEIADKPKGKLRSLHVSPAENGYAVETDRETPNEDKGENDGPTYQPPIKHVFQSKKDVLAHIGKHLE